MKTNILYTVLIIVLIIAIVIVISLSGSSSSIIKKPNSKEISEIIQNENVIIIDVRTKEEYESGHIKDSINIPYNEIENKVNYDKNKTIAVYCRTGVRSNKAAKTLEKMGYTKIYDLGGIENIDAKLTTD